MDIAVEYLEVTDPKGAWDGIELGPAIVYRAEVADRVDAAARWATMRTEWPGCTAQWHRHQHYESARACEVEALP